MIQIFDYVVCTELSVNFSINVSLRGWVTLTYNSFRKLMVADFLVDWVPIGRENI